MNKVIRLFVFVCGFVSFSSFAQSFKLCKYLSMRCARPVLQPVSGTLLSQSSASIIERGVKGITYGFREYSYLDSRGIQVSDIRVCGEEASSQLRHIHCLDAVIPEEIAVLGLIQGSYPNLASLILGHHKLGLKELLIRSRFDQTDSPLCLTPMDID